MAIKPGRKSAAKNPPILSHEFVIQNHADIVSCFALIFVVGLMVQATSSLASVFIALHHSVAGAEPSAENPRGEKFFYESGWKDICAVAFYTLICIIMHAILQEYLLDKLSKKFQITTSKARLARFNESGQMVFFALMSFVWGAKIMIDDGFLGQMSLMWKDYPEHPMSFLLKLFYIIQIAYYLHMLPELYFQRVKREDQNPKIIKSMVGLLIIGATYYFKMHRAGVLLLSMHYFSDFIAHVYTLADMMPKADKLMVQFGWLNDAVFVLTRFAIMVLGVLLLFYGINTTPALVMLFFTYLLQGQQFVYFIQDYFTKRRERVKSKISTRTKKSKAPAPAAVTESDLPEADQNAKSKTK